MAVWIAFFAGVSFGLLVAHSGVKCPCKKEEAAKSE
jgi:hypothetical protein